MKHQEGIAYAKAGGDLALEIVRRKFQAVAAMARKKKKKNLEWWAKLVVRVLKDEMILYTRPPAERREMRALMNRIIKSIS